MIKYLGLKIGDTLKVEQKMDTYKNRVVSGGHISLQSHRTRVATKECSTKLLLEVGNLYQLFTTLGLEPV